MLFTFATVLGAVIVTAVAPLVVAQERPASSTASHIFGAMLAFPLFAIFIFIATAREALSLIGLIYALVLGLIVSLPVAIAAVAAFRAGD